MTNSSPHDHWFSAMERDNLSLQPCHMVALTSICFVPPSHITTECYWADFMGHVISEIFNISCDYIDLLEQCADFSGSRKSVPWKVCLTVWLSDCLCTATLPLSTSMPLADHSTQQWALFQAPALYINDIYASSDTLYPLSIMEKAYNCQVLQLVVQVVCYLWVV